MHRLWALVAAAVFTWFVAAPAYADDLETIKKDGRFVWGADQEGGGPFIWPSDDNPDVVIGFEVDFARKLGEYLQVKDEFYQGQWDKLLDMLRADKVQLVINGYEWEPERAQHFDASIPYYVYGLQLMARKDDGTIQSLEDLRKPNADGSRRRVGVLTGSAAEDYMRENYGEVVEVINYDGGTDTMIEVQNNKLDATLQDTPIAGFYLKEFEGLHLVDKPVAPGYYVVYVRKGEAALLRAVNEAIILMYRQGDLERIYKKYGIWDENQTQLGALIESGKFYGYLNSVVSEVEKNDEMPTQEEVETANFDKGSAEVFTQYFPVLAQSALMTVALSLASFPIAILIGLLVAIGRLYGPLWIRLPLTAYVEFVRGTPLMLQLYFIFFLLPEIGINIPAFPTAVLGLALNYGAYESEIYRAGLQAIPNGQMEAALSLGMPRSMAIRRIIVPQAFRIVIPPVVNDFIALFKDTSVASVVTIVELTKRFSVLAMSTQAIIEMMIMTCILYLMMSYPMSLLARYVEKRLQPTGGVS